MNFEELLREEHYSLKNQISQLKNAFDINKDILSILVKHDSKDDPQHLIFLKIISKLTSLNNQAMMSTVQLIQQKNALKAKIYRLNVELNRLEERLNQEIKRNNQMITTPTQARLLLHDQFNKLNRQLLAFNQQRIAFEHELNDWRQNLIVKLQLSQKQQHNEGEREIGDFKKLIQASKKCKVKRKYTLNQQKKYDWMTSEQQKLIRRQKKTIEQLENRLKLIAKAYNIQEQSTKNRQVEMKCKPEWQKELKEVGLLKYALNVITVKKKNDDIYMNIIHRFRHQIDPEQKRKRNVHSWPKFKQFKYQIADEVNIAKFVQNTLKTQDSK